MGRLKPGQPSSFDGRVFDAAVARVVSNDSYLGSYDQLYAMIQMLGTELCEKLSDPELDPPSRTELLIEIVDPVVERILEDDGDWYTGERLMQQLKLADSSNEGVDLRTVLQEFFYQYAIDIGQMMRYAETPGVLPEQWNWQPKALTTRAALVLHGYEIEDDDEFIAYNDFVAGRASLPQDTQLVLDAANQAWYADPEGGGEERFTESLAVEVLPPVQLPPPPINVVINMPEQKQPDVVVHNHVEKPDLSGLVVNPVINLNPELTIKPVPFSFKRDADGKISGAEPESKEG